MSRFQDLLCFSHLRWGFVFQRPNHLLSRAARTRRTFFVEEPIHDAPPGAPYLEIKDVAPTLFACVPHVPPGLAGPALDAALRTRIDILRRDLNVHPDVLWFYTPMALRYARHLHAPLSVYDCMDELSAFAGASSELPRLEEELFGRVDLVFTGGHSLYQAKRRRHGNIHPFPSSVDAAHFGAARSGVREPADQASVPHPRIGFFGVIDERLDLGLIDRVSRERPAWHWVLLGPVAKIDPTTLPRRENIHWLGRKDYADLPAYLSAWDVAAMPFALNAATAFISPTKTLEYMAAGKPVVSTAIADVVNPYGVEGAVRIADADTFADAVEEALAKDPAEVRRTSDAWVARTSWDQTWRQMEELMARTLAGTRGRREKTEGSCSTT